jgi:predicted Fe-Mo cluster-binding NifX family protein
MPSVGYAPEPSSFANIRKGDFEVKIAVTSQNRRTITEHAGKCRKFWVYDIEQGQVTGKTLLELPIEQSLHESSPQESHPLDAVQVLITGGMGPGLQNRLAGKGITALMTAETDPDQAVAAYLQGTLVTGAGSCDHGAHQHHHHHRHT